MYTYIGYMPDHNLCHDMAGDRASTAASQPHRNRIVMASSLFRNLPVAPLMLALAP
jgi:hypothetical protein